MIARKAIAAVAAILLFAVPAAGPANADDDDLVKVLAGIAAMAVVGKAIEEHNKGRAEAAAKEATAAIPATPTGCRGATWNGKQWVDANNRPCVAKANSEVLRTPKEKTTQQVEVTPAVCLREQWQDGRVIKFFDRTCMANLGFRLTTLF